MHIWDNRADKLYSDIEHHEKFFSTDNDFSYVEFIDRYGKVRFHAPAPALTKLWIYRADELFVGLSHIKKNNPYQLVIWRSDGTLLHYQSISAYEIAKLTEAEKHDFEDRFPEAIPLLSNHYFTYNQETYVDFRNTPYRWEGRKYLLEHYKSKHPYSNDFFESATNLIEWFNRDITDIKIEKSENIWTLSLRSPSGITMVIPLTDCNFCKSPRRAQ